MFATSAVWADRTGILSAGENNDHELACILSHVADSVRLRASDEGLS